MAKKTSGSSFNPDYRYVYADDLIKINRTEDALVVLDELLKEFPGHAMSLNTMGWIYETRLSDLQRAEEFYKKALELQPDNPALYYNMAILLSALERYSELDTLLRKAINVQGIVKSSIENEWGIMFEMLGEYEEAIRHYQNAIRQTTDSKNMQAYQDAIERCREKQSMDL
jgi:tetratricopeptide (TPR) repeat protein